jgi:hypothetical protein
MAIGKWARNASAAQGESASDRPAGLKRNSYVRPYRQFERGGVRRFRGVDVVFRPFRIS